MQNLIPKFKKSSIISEKQIIFLKNWKLWQAPTRIEKLIFFAEISFLLMSTKVYSEYLKFYLYLELLINLVFVGPFVKIVK